MTISEAKRQVSLSAWAERIQARQASGQNIRNWCAENGLRENQYYYWLKEIRKETLERTAQVIPKTSGEIVKVELPSSAAELADYPFEQSSTVAPDTGYIRLQIGAGKLEIPPGTQSKDLLEILKAVVMV